MDTENIIEWIKKELHRINKNFKDKISIIHAGRATPTLVENIMVNYYGTMTPIKQIAAIDIPDQRSILIQPWDKNQLKEIEKSIRNSQLGFSPINDGEAIRIIIPQPTGEERKNLVKHLNDFMEKARISARSVREEAMKKIKQMEKDKLISEDERFRKQDEIQKIIDEYNKKIEEEANKKENDIMTI